MITDHDGNVATRMHYTPYGEVLKEQSTGDNISKYKYTAQEYDDSTELHYYKARFYDPGLGRFISADDVVQNPIRTQALNRYAYVEGNPIKFRDLAGNSKIGDFFKDLAKKVSGGAKKAWQGAKGAWDKITSKNWWKEHCWKSASIAAAPLLSPLIIPTIENWDDWGKTAVFFAIAILIVVASFGVGSFALPGAGMAMGIWASSGFVIGGVIGGTRGDILHPDKWGDLSWDWEYAAMGAAAGAAIAAAGQMIPGEVGFMRHLPLELRTPLLNAGVTSVRLVFYKQALQSAYDKELSFTFGYYQNDYEAFFHFKFFGYKKRWYIKENEQ